MYWSVKERGHKRAIWASCGPLGDQLSALPEDFLVCVCASATATCPLQWGSVKERPRNAEGWYSLLSWHLYDSAMPSYAFCLSEKSGSTYKTEGIFWVQFDVILFWWCISIVLQEFIYQHPNVLSVYCNKNCQRWPNCLKCKRFEEIKWQILRLQDIYFFLIKLGYLLLLWVEDLAVLFYAVIISCAIEDSVESLFDWKHNSEHGKVNEMFVLSVSD